MQPSETGISVTKAGSLSICQRLFLHILRAHKLFCRPQVSGINNVMLGLLVAIIRGYTMLYYAILPFVYPTNSSVWIGSFPYKLPTGRDWRNTLVLVMGRFLQERAALASKGRHQRLHIFLAVLAHSFGPLGAKSLLSSQWFLPAPVTQYSSEAMAMLWLAEGMILDNATFHIWKTG